ncbi:hypothetical protein AB0J20_16190 [Micromonospora costi]|uniref:hypothetical protein n=1 Tax=Micromonospora costi TaxID=1530042 RepID=UPI00341089B7
MCSINGTCGCQRGTGSFLLALGAALAWRLLKLLAKTVQLLVVALVALTLWAAPRGWRLARRGYRQARRRYAMRPVVLDRKPAAALPERTTAMTLADLRLKEPANS